PGMIYEGSGTLFDHSDLSAPSTPTRLGDFELVRRLGAGAMGVVFEARQVSLNRPVAVQMIRAGLFAGEGDLRRVRLQAGGDGGPRSPAARADLRGRGRPGLPLLQHEADPGREPGEAPGRVPRRPSRLGAVGGRGRPGDPARPRPGHPAPRPEAVEYPARR